MGPLRRVWALTWIAALGCASAPQGWPRLGTEMASATHAGWIELEQGQHGGALARFEERLAVAPDDILAHLGAFAITHARADSAASLAHGIAILEAAAGKGAAEADAALAVVAVMPTLLDEAADRDALRRLNDLVDAVGLPWAVRFTLAQIGDTWARRVGDQAEWRRHTTRAGCVQGARFTGSIGRFPLSDLTTAPTARQQERQNTTAGDPIATAGCRMMVSTRSSQPGVLVIHADVDLARGWHAVVLDYAGVAALRVDGGPWHHHGSTERYASAWSAAHLDLAPGGHQIEVRLASHDGSAALSLAVLPTTKNAWPLADADPLDVLDTLDGPGTQAVSAYAGGWAATLLGDADALLLAADRLQRLPRFAPGAVLAGLLFQSDPSRPSHLVRDRARVEYGRAVAIDETLARPLWALAELEQVESRPRDATRLAEQAVDNAPGFWPAFYTLHQVHATSDLERAADQALDQALAILDRDRDGIRGCAVMEAALVRARRRRLTSQEDALAERVAACDARSFADADTLRARGRLSEAAVRLQRAADLSFPDVWAAAELAEIWSASGRFAQAADLMRDRLATAPRNLTLRMRLADALWAAGDRAAARAVLEDGLALAPTSLQLRQAARVMGLPLPLRDFRVDGLQVVKDYLQSNPAYDAPAVVVLDRLVERVQADGTLFALTHNIVRVHSKDAIDRWGEVPVPAGAEILNLRTLKADGRVLEPEEIAGKDTVSAPELAPGDFVEWETLQWQPPLDAFAPGFIGARFYFGTFDAPLHRSEYLLITPPMLDVSAFQIDARAGAPVVRHTVLPDGSRLATWAADRVPQMFSEAATVAVRDWVPSVRVSVGVDVATWRRHLSDRTALMARSNPDVDRLAIQLAETGGTDPRCRIDAMVRWVNANIEAEGGLDEPATFTLARGRGNRVGLLMALARRLDVPVDLVLARSLFLADAGAPLIVQDLEDFAYPLLAFRPDGVSGAAVFVDPRLRYAPVGYLPPGLDGAPLVCACAEGPAIAGGGDAPADVRQVNLEAHVQSDGGATITISERLVGLPALHWIETLDRIGQDDEKLQREFEERWLSIQFPGAALEALKVDAPKDADAARLEYRFKLARFATLQDNGLIVRPNFFQSQPGRRFASEAQRKTPLFISHETPLDLVALFRFPTGAKVIDAGSSGDFQISGVAGMHFQENRVVVNPDPARSLGPGVQIGRASRVPIARVDPAAYPRVGRELRRVDPVQSSPIRVRLADAPR